MMLQSTTTNGYTVGYTVGCDGGQAGGYTPAEHAAEEEESLGAKGREPSEDLLVALAQMEARGEVGVQARGIESKWRARRVALWDNYY